MKVNAGHLIGRQPKLLEQLLRVNLGRASDQFGYRETVPDHLLDRHDLTQLRQIE